MWVVCQRDFDINIVLIVVESERCRYYFSEYLILYNVEDMCMEDYMEIFFLLQLLSIEFDMNCYDDDSDGSDDGSV